MSRKSLVRGGTRAEISCSSTRPISCKRHKAIPARGREARRPGRRQSARRAPQPENLGTTATFFPEPWRNTQDLTELRQPRFPQNRGVTRKIPRLPITQQSESHTVSKKAEDWDSGEAYKKVANEGKRVSIFEIKKEIQKERKPRKSHKICGERSRNLHI